MHERNIARNWVDSFVSFTKTLFSLPQTSRKHYWRAYENRTKYTGPFEKQSNPAAINYAIFVDQILTINYDTDVNGRYEVDL